MIRYRASVEASLLIVTSESTSCRYARLVKPIYINCIQRFHTFFLTFFLELNLHSLLSLLSYISFHFSFSPRLSPYYFHLFRNPFHLFFFLLFSFSVKSLMVEMTTGVAVSSCGNVCFATLAAVTENCLLVSVTFSNVSFMFPSCSFSFTFFLLFV